MDLITDADVSSCFFGCRSVLKDKGESRIVEGPIIDIPGLRIGWTVCF